MFHLRIVFTLTALKYRYLLFSFITIISILIFLYQYLGLFLIVKDPLPAKIDILFVTSGDDDRLKYANEIVSKYRDTYFLISKSATDTQSVNGTLNRSLIVDTCKNTLSEVDLLFSTINENSVTDTINVGIVSSLYHMRRVQILSNKFRKKSTKIINVHYLPALHPQIDLIKVYKNWWSNKKLRSIVIRESIKTFMSIFIII